MKVRASWGHISLAFLFGKVVNTIQVLITYSPDNLAIVHLNKYLPRCVYISFMKVQPIKPFIFNSIKT